MARNPIKKLDVPRRRRVWGSSDEKDKALYYDPRSPESYNSPLRPPKADQNPIEKVEISEKYLHKKNVKYKTRLTQVLVQSAALVKSNPRQFPVTLKNLFQTLASNAPSEFPKLKGELEALVSRIDDLANVEGANAEKGQNDTANEYVVPVGLPQSPDKYWVKRKPGRPPASEADRLVSFLMEVYGRHMHTHTNELRSYIFHKDRALYDAINEFERQRPLPDDILIPDRNDRSLARKHAQEAIDLDKLSNTDAAVLRADRGTPQGRNTRKAKP